MNKKKIIILVSLVAVVFIVIFAISAKLYPIVFVGWHPVIYGDFNKDYNAAIIYYQKAVLTYNNDADIMNSSEIRNEIKRAGIEAEIEDILISNELKKWLGSSETQAQTQKSVDAAISGNNIDKEIEELYGLSSSEFIKRFLEPQARREILEARLRLENALPNDDFGEWLKNAKNQLRVMIFLPGFEWKDGTVIVKN